MILISPPGQVRKAGCPLTPCWYAVRAAACAGSLTSSSSQRARSGSPRVRRPEAVLPNGTSWWIASTRNRPARSEEHTSELQSRSDLVCRLLLEKKKKKKSTNDHREDLD